MQPLQEENLEQGQMHRMQDDLSDLDRLRRSRSTFEMKTNAKKENAPQIAMWRTATAAILCNMSELEQKWAQQPRFLDAAAQSLFGQTETFVQTWQKFQTPKNFLKNFRTKKRF
jgi:hypothetical protein